LAKIEIPWDEYTILNENNITYFLSFLEELTSTLVMYSAAKRGEVNPALAAVSYDKIEVKSFK
jgi:hypothetical protein